MTKVSHQLENTVKSKTKVSRKNTKESITQQRRELIFEALHECIIEKGYASTTLADVARVAGISPSHLLYYFKQKVDILSQYFDNVAQRITFRLKELQSEETSQRIDLMSNLFFGGKGLSKSEIGFMLECFGVAVHDPRLKQQKAALDRLCKEYLQSLFDDLLGEPASAADLAELAYAILVGLRTAVYFDERLSVKKAHEIFRNEMARMVKARTAKGPAGTAAKRSPH